MKKLSVLTLAVAAIACSAAMAADLPTSDAAALQAIGKGNQKVAEALELSGAVGALADAKECATVEMSQRGMCVVMAKAFGMLAYVTGKSAAVAVAAAPAQAPQVINAAPPPTVGERIVGFLAGAANKLFDVGMALGPAYMNMRSANHVSDNNTRAAIASSANALAATQSTNATFAGFGNNLQDTATAGFRSNVRLASEGFGAVTAVADRGFQVAGAFASKPTTQITTGDGSPVVIGTGNTVQGGHDNRQGSAGPCTVTGTTTGQPTTGTSNPSTNGSAPCTN